MAHECIDCGQQCYCDGEDHGQPTPIDCNHCDLATLNINPDDYCDDCGVLWEYCRCDEFRSEATAESTSSGAASQQEGRADG